MKPLLIVLLAAVLSFLFCWGIGAILVYALGLNIEAWKLGLALWVIYIAIPNECSR